MKKTITVLMLALAVMFGGCATPKMEAGGKYDGAGAAYTTDVFVDIVDKGFDSFLKWEAATHEKQPVKVQKLANRIRTEADANWFPSYFAVRDAYLANPTKEGEKQLLQIKSTIKAILDEALTYLAQSA